uniref:Uncharacterized protein n=1 Tax=Setaria viridis TaxID=4556 RepID=A0A4U6SWR9_SETVI|nr:hypothetical protein SEVIR_9G226450v2 [Setaria viridis]
MGLARGCLRPSLVQRQAWAGRVWRRARGQAAGGGAAAARQATVGGGRRGGPVGGSEGYFFYFFLFCKHCSNGSL